MVAARNTWIRVAKCLFLLSRLPAETEKVSPPGNMAESIFLNRVRESQSRTQFPATCSAVLHTIAFVVLRQPRSNNLRTLNSSLTEKYLEHQND